MDKWVFVTGRNGFIKEVICNGNKITASSLMVNYEPERKLAIITIKTKDFSIETDSAGEGVLGKDE